jgi:pSer/pThr/pTyr-binding forkhead associated (FHA) protein
VKRSYLVIEYDPNQGKEIYIEKDSVIIGRGPTCDVVITNERISRRHARIFFVDGRWMIEDLGSTNHTLLEKNELAPGEKTVLTKGYHIQLASQVILIFLDPDSTLDDLKKVITDELWLDVSRGDVYIHNWALSPRLNRRGFNILKLLYEKSLTPCPIAGLEEIAAVGWPSEYSYLIP